jgi:hypothetical protein
MPVVAGRAFVGRFCSLTRGGNWTPGPNAPGGDEAARIDADLARYDL